MLFAHHFEFNAVTKFRHLLFHLLDFFVIFLFLWVNSFAQTGLVKWGCTILVDNIKHILILSIVAGYNNPDINLLI